MDLLRIECDFGPCYIDGRALLLLTKVGDNTDVQVVYGSNPSIHLSVAGDVDEFSAGLESAFPACRIIRVN